MIGVWVPETKPMQGGLEWVVKLAPVFKWLLLVHCNWNWQYSGYLASQCRKVKVQNDVNITQAFTEIKRFHDIP